MLLYSESVYPLTSITGDRDRGKVAMLESGMKGVIHSVIA